MIVWLNGRSGCARLGLERRAVYEAALPWLRDATTVIDTTAMTPVEVAEAVAG